MRFKIEFFGQYNTSFKFPSFGLWITVYIGSNDEHKNPTWEKKGAYSARLGFILWISCFLKKARFERIYRCSNYRA
ncbi:hypothetical protein GCM10025859_62820 [Alicyclobacillus fastidiosus]|nr:hypothetical protein GCM10025859_62820 [Alicyclobacillus fastidiosus]